ncbi:hypothetical protein BB558_003477 [Smittium angustum]|uniref:Uncharacterized protein n=1 Tax=Smittium angustum TaxID=133377 RepID=A0A2U1J5W5_SMIAN|nr:hypothetical protein BB558_004840 [Smittium angustum]PWA00482.1 hypothetical protein BB558_003477 [Smittium angustum]
MYLLSKSFKTFRSSRSLHTIRTLEPLLLGWGSYLSPFLQDSPLIHDSDHSVLSSKETTAVISPSLIDLRKLFKTNNIRDLEVSAVGAGFAHFLISLFNPKDNTSKVAGVGLNRFSQLGKHTTENPAHVLYSIPGKVSQISCGREHSMILVDLEKDLQEVYVSGSNVYGQLGILDSKDNSKKHLNHKFPLGMELSPIRSLKGFIDHDSKISQISCGLDHSLILGDNGKVYAMGWSADGQCGTGETKNVYQPSLVKGLDNVKVEMIGTSTDFTLALSQNKKLYCWGNGEYRNNMANIEDDKILSAINVVTDFGEIKSVAAGGAHSVALNTEGNVFTCGFGALGLGENNTHFVEPIQIPSLQNIADIYASTDYCLAKSINNEFFVWGLNNTSEVLGIGERRHAFEPHKLRFDHLKIDPEYSLSKVALGNSNVFLY